MWAGFSHFVKNKSVNPHLRGGNSRLSPNLVREIIFCTFADVKECFLPDTPPLGWWHS